MYGLVDTFAVFFCFHLLGFLISFGRGYTKSDRGESGEIRQRRACVYGFRCKVKGAICGVLLVIFMFLSQNSNLI